MPCCCRIILDLVACFRLFEEEIRFSTCPKKNKKKLENEMDTLRRMQQDVNTFIDKQKRTKPGTECKVDVRSWLDAVNIIENEVKALLESLVQTSSCTCCWSPRDNYRLGNNVADLIVRVNSLVEERKRFGDGNLVQQIPRDPIHNIPDLSTPMVGRDGTSSEIHGYLRDSQVTTIGIWGMEGIGKTTMLKSIKHGLRENYDFFYVVWIEMSQNVDIPDIQEQIAKCISLSLPPSQDEKERAGMLANALRPRKSLILIDNVWKKLEYETIGIPFAMGTDVVKIVFTTRTRRVCREMKAQKTVRLDFLDKAESLQLFQENISSDVDLTDRNMSQLKDEIIEICGGLPQTILTVAGNVAYCTEVQEWEAAVVCLRRSTAENEGMKYLKFSYDRLEKNEKSCLLYFSLYPEGGKIETDKLIKEWLSEGLLDIPNNNSFMESYNRGAVILRRLKSICLVESGFFNFEVKVHDVIRDMMITEHDNREVVLVYDNDDDSSNYDDWDLAKSICLYEHQVKRLPETGMPSCPNLTILRVQEHSNQIDKLPTEDFFHFTPSLRVLDLSFTSLKVIPKSIGELVELRYLNLYQTLIHTLPMELGNLKKLKCLDLGETDELATVVGSAISQLSMLQSLNLMGTKYQWNSNVNTTKLKLDDLNELKNLEDLCVNVWQNSHLNTILGNQKLLHSIRKIRFIGIDFTKELQLTKLISERFPRLVDLFVDLCALPNIWEIKDNLCDRPLVKKLDLWKLQISSVIMNDGCHPLRGLKSLQIFCCQSLKEVSWTAHVPSLEELYLIKCNGIKELILPKIVVGITAVEEEIEESDCYFPKLYTLEIRNMENLERIHGRSRPLLFPALRNLSITNCPKLKQLSFDHDSAKHMEIIECKQQQWDLLEWENDQVRSRFLRYVRA